MEYRKHIPPLRAMLAVEATARLGSFSKAAAELNITQSAVSHLVGETEAMLSTRLFERGSRPVVLTEAGRRYVAAVVSGLTLIGAEGEALQRARDDVLTVSCNLAYANFWLLPKLKMFHALRPDIVVNMVTAYQGLPALSGEIELSIRFGKGDWEGWIRFFLAGVAAVADEAAETARRIVALQEDQKRVVQQTFGRVAPDALLVHDHLFRQPYITVQGAQRVTGREFAATNRLIARMVEAGILEEATGRARYRVFVHSKYVRIFEEPPDGRED